MHIFLGLCNTLAAQFKKEAEDQKKQEKEGLKGMPNLRSFGDVSNIAKSISNNSFNVSNFKMPHF